MYIDHASSTSFHQPDSMVLGGETWGSWAPDRSVSENEAPQLCFTGLRRGYAMSEMPTIVSEWIVLGMAGAIE